MQRVIDMNFLEWAFVLWNGIVLLVYGYDKLKSKGKGQRVPEKTLLWLGAIFGGAGALGGMYLFRHKTKHRRFWVLNTLSLILQLVLLGFYLTNL